MRRISEMMFASSLYTTLQLLAFFNNQKQINKNILKWEINKQNQNKQQLKSS